ncbi:MAG: DUF167 domain-containing protein [Thermoplasmata archaeon]
MEASSPGAQSKKWSGGSVLRSGREGVSKGRREAYGIALLPPQGEGMIDEKAPLPVAGVNGHHGALPGVSAAIRPAEGGVVIEVETRPGSSTPGKLSYDSWRRKLRITLSERAEKGRANAELLECLSRILGVQARTLSIASGARSRRKCVFVAGLAEVEILRRLVPQLELEGWRVVGAKNGCGSGEKNGASGRQKGGDEG